MTDTKATEDARIGALETKVADLTETVSRLGSTIARIEADLAMLGDRPAIDAAPLADTEVQHIRAVLSRFASDAPPARVSDDD